MDWRDWNDEAFTDARERGCPVLLFLTASWCRWCRELEHEVLATPEVSALIHDRFVAIRVDKDRRPDIDARYSKGGWPTLAYLDDAGELIGSDAYLEAQALLLRLDLVADYYGENRDSIRQRLAESAELGLDEPQDPRGELSPVQIEWVARTVAESADPTFGGWGTHQKFPHPEAIDFALLRWSQTGDDAMRRLVMRTLNNMERGEIHDRVEGGFYRYATAPDWSAPHYEKMLDSNAQRLRAYVEAHQALGNASYRETALGIIEWMNTTLLDPQTQAFKGSQDADPTYSHRRTIEERRRGPAPECDPTIFTNWNAIAASALFKAGVVLEQDDLLQQGQRTLDFLMEELFDARSGMHHYWDGSYHLSGLLSDQAYTLRALLDGVQFAGETRYLQRAIDLANVTIENLRSPQGGFFDTRHDPGARGGLRRRNRSILENSVMAEALLRLSHLAFVPDYADTARETLEAFVPDYKRYGHFVAGYARAIDLALNPPVHVTVVGPAGRSDTRALQCAALAPYVASRIVQVVDPATDGELLAHAGLPAPGTGDDVPSRAYVHRGRESYAETSDPGRLPALMTRIERAS